MRRWIACLALVLAPLPVAAQTLADIVERVKPAIVGVGTYSPTARPPAQVQGTGFAVGDGSYVLTNLHVVPEKLKKKEKQELVIFIGTGLTAEARVVELAMQDPDHDVAILKVPGTPLPTLVLGDDTAVREGDPIAFTGFPIGAVFGLYPATHRGIVAAWTPIAVPALSPRQLNAKTIKRLKQDFFVFQLDATAFPGNSGSPLWDVTTGKVIGIVSSVFVKESKESALSDPSGVTFAVPIRYAKAALQELGAIP